MRRTVRVAARWEAVRFDFGVQGAQTNIEHPRHLLPRRIGLKIAAQNFLLCILKRHAEWQADFARRRHLANIGRKILQSNLFPAGREYQAFNHVTQLAHIARPRVIDEAFYDVVREVTSPLVIFLAEFPQNCRAMSAIASRRSRNAGI